MTDFDHRYSGLKNAPPPAEHLKCPRCGYLNEVSSADVLKLLDPKYPAQTHTVLCTNCSGQLVLQARPSGSSKA